jgi:hypothetical protein
MIFLRLAIPILSAYLSASKIYTETELQTLTNQGGFEPNSLRLEVVQLPLMRLYRQSRSNPFIAQRRRWIHGPGQRKPMRS